MYNKEILIKIHPVLKYKYFLDKNHPLATGNAGFVYLHRHIISINRGYWLTTDEHVHHIDENKLNNDIDNLLVCSKKEHTHIHKGTMEKQNCLNCNKQFVPSSIDQKYCSNECSINSSIRLDGLTKEELEILIWTIPFTELGKIYNCSDNGIRKWAR